eukprot:CCRYP_019973-RA/>CCRYP_019973-RA protein AED:0.00 eAED:0.00 QI:115/1/1/1/1/1/2/460/149
MLSLTAKSIGRRAVVSSARLVLPVGIKVSDQYFTTTRHHSTGKQYVVLNTVGTDRPGIVADVTRIVTQNGGNVGESRAQLLGGHFSLMMLVEIASTDMETLRRQLESDVVGMNTTCFDAVDPKSTEMKPHIGCECRRCLYLVVIVLCRC